MRATPRQRTRVDWGAARARYIALGPTDRSYANISREFGVSETSVRKWARREDWAALAADADAKAAAKATATAIRALELRQADTVRVAEILRRRALRLEEPDGGDVDLELAIRLLPQYAKLEQLFAGEATDRVALAEAQAVVMAVVRVAGKFVPADRREAFLRELDDATGGLAALEGAAA
jgi:hypothetical protein